MMNQASAEQGTENPVAKTRQTAPGASSALGRSRVQKSGDEIVPIHNWIYHVMFNAYGMFYQLGGLKIHGRENVPLEGPLIVAPNHASLFDPPLVGYAMPRMVTTMGKAELFEKKTCGLKILGYVIQRMGTFPVRRGTPDRRALRRAIHVLKEGGALVIFPEGTRTRTGELGPAEPGLGLIAHATRAPVLPVYLKGTEAGFSYLHPKPSLIHPEVYFGKPLTFEPEYERRADRATLEAIGARVMQEIARLRDGAGSEEAATEAIQVG